MPRTSSKNTQYNGGRKQLQGQGNLSDALDDIDGEVKQWSVVAYISGVSKYAPGVLM